MSKVNRSTNASDLSAGLVYGILAGLAFSLTTWGTEALGLASSSAGFPWLKFVLGASLCSLVGGLAGWITSRADSSLAGAVTWFAAGLIFCLVASRLPFEGLTLFLRALKPEFANLVYPYPENMHSRMVVVYILVLLCSTLAGTLQAYLIETARSAQTAVMQALILMVVVPFFALAGQVAYDYINEPFIRAIVQIGDLLEFHQELNGQKVDPKLSAEKHYRALGPILFMANRPYRLYLSGYESQSLDTFTVLIDFEGEWAECSVLISSVGTCKPGAAFSKLSTIGMPASLPTPTPRSSTPAVLSSTPTVTVPAEAGQPGAVLPEQSEAPQAMKNNPTQATPGLPQYDIALQIDLPGLAYYGRAIIDYTNNTGTALDQIFLRLLPNGQDVFGDGSLTVSEFQVDGKTARPIYSRQNTALQVKLSTPLAPGDKTQLEINFNGTVPRDYGTNDSGYGIFNYTDEVLALAAWYPMLAVYDQDGWNLDLPSPIGDSVYAEMADYSVEVQAPANQIIAATGVTTSRTEQDGIATWQFESGPAREFFLIMSPDFEVTRKMVSGTQVNSYYLNGHARPGEQALEIAADSLEIYNAAFGDYPFTELDVIDAPMKNAAGVEFPGIVLIGSYLYDQPENPRFSVATAHEVAHQWWYNLVGNDVFEHPWLDEALTTYSSLLYYEKTGQDQGTRIMQETWQQSYDKVLNDGEDRPVAESLEYFERPENQAYYGRIVYTKGALFFQALRALIGDQAFFAALRDYFQTFQYQIAEPEDLLARFETYSDQSLAEFYEEWLFSTRP
ncbi:MAG: M1 family metallopeptidase [Anaerolineales bacterium]|jgi:hypothetical protein|nr:M1 family metallopeptidase [Anaerolineales bacterium]